MPADDRPLPPGPALHGPRRRSVREDARDRAGAAGRAARAVGAPCTSSASRWPSRSATTRCAPLWLGRGARRAAGPHAGAAPSGWARRSATLARARASAPAVRAGPHARPRARELDPARARAARRECRGAARATRLQPGPAARRSTAPRTRRSGCSTASALGLIDFDRLALGDPEADVAAFMEAAAPRTTASRSPRRSRAATASSTRAGSDYYRRERTRRQGAAGGLRPAPGRRRASGAPAPRAAGALGVPTAVVVLSVNVSVLLYAPVRSASLALIALAEAERDRVVGDRAAVRQQVQRRGRGADVVVRRARVGGVAGAGLQRLRQGERAVDQVAGVRASSGRPRSAARRRRSRSRWPWSTPRTSCATPGVNGAELRRRAERQRQRRRHGAADGAGRVGERARGRPAPRSRRRSAASPCSCACRA